MRVLVLAEAANPEWPSVPLVGWSHARALSRVVDAHTVTQIRNRDAWLRAGVPEAEFTAIDTERVAKRVYAVERFLRRGKGTGWTTSMALRWIPYLAFERAVWRAFGERIRAREFDVVHRVTPVSPTIPSSMAKRCAGVGVPFVAGPLNGGLPWPRGFDRERRREREWLSYVRGAYRVLPHARSMRRHASALVIGSRATWEQQPARVRERCVYLPENAIDTGRFPSDTPRRPSPPPVRVAFLGRLVPYKGCDMLLEGAAPLIREGTVEIDIIGDGPERHALEHLVERERIGSGVTFAGWVPHAEVAARLGRAHVLGFPSVREFGGAVVIEAMALGVCPIVVDYGGPGELASEASGFLIPMGRREAIVARLGETLRGIVSHPEELRARGVRARERALNLFTWDAKARQMVEVYRWVTGSRADRPDFGMPLRDRPIGEDFRAESPVAVA